MKRIFGALSSSPVTLYGSSAFLFTIVWLAWAVAVIGLHKLNAGALLLLAGFGGVMLLIAVGVIVSVATIRLMLLEHRVWAQTAIESVATRHISERHSDEGADK